MPGKILSPQAKRQPEGGYIGFRIGDLFEIKPTKAYRMTNDVLYAVRGQVPVVSNSSMNNGIGGYVGLAPTESGNMITYSDTTTSDAIFYQPNDFIGYSHVQGLYPKQSGWTEKSLLYFIAAFKKSAGGKFDYANKFNRAVAAQLTVMLPANAAGQPDLAFMSSRIRELEEERIRELEAYIKACGFDNTSLTPPEINKLRSVENKALLYRRFRIVDLFEVSNAHNILKTDIVMGSGMTPYVTACEGNNSIVGYIDYDNRFVELGDVVFIGGKTLVITYQPQDFFSNDSHNLLLRSKSKECVSENIQLFYVAALSKALSHKYSWGNSISKAKIKSDYVTLPVDKSGNVDYRTMDLCINAVKKNVISKIATFISRESKAYKAVVNGETTQYTASGTL